MPLGRPIIQYVMRRGAYSDLETSYEQSAPLDRAPLLQHLKDGSDERHRSDQSAGHVAEKVSAAPLRALVQLLHLLLGLLFAPLVGTLVQMAPGLGLLISRWDSCKILSKIIPFKAVSCWLFLDQQ